MFNSQFFVRLFLGGGEGKGGSEMCPYLYCNANESLHLVVHNYNLHEGTGLCNVLTLRASVFYYTYTLLRTFLKKFYSKFTCKINYLPFCKFYHP